MTEWGRRLFRITCGVAIVLAVAVAPQRAAAEATVTLPDYSRPLLSPASQASAAWTNVIPNALASYFTYVPYSNANAVALGFPASCGNKALGTAADQASTEDCYTITVKSFTQQLSLPASIGFGGPGLLNQSGAPFGPTELTRVYGYGSGGQNWTPPGASVAVTGNAPKPFTDGSISTAGIWHFPAPTIKGTKGRPIRVQWLNELPNVEPSGFDPTVDCGQNAADCFPYNRIVTHVHGAHVQDDSDGYASAWFTPGFALTGPGWASSTYGPQGTYRYPMDQEAATIWYHDHALGVTHNNTQMGMAGFFPVTDTNEQALIAANILPTGAYELGFALQDRMFDTDGQFAMPDYPIYDLYSPGCTLTEDGLADPLTCRRLDWMRDPADAHLVPYIAEHPFLEHPINAGAPYPAASTSLEYFGNMPVVNGVTYGTYAVEPRVYRMRFIGGTDSRTWIMKLVNRTTSAVIPFWQVGSEQGLLNNPVQRTSMDLMPGERLDVLVDLTGIAAGTRLVLQNIGPDAPYAGPDDPGMIPSVDIPEIMEFTVVPLVGTDSSATPSPATSLRAPIVPLTTTPGTPVRNVSLVEIADEYGRTMPTIDSRGFMEMGIPATELVRQNDVEEWDIINTTVDAHPMHLHLVAFQLVNRQAFDPLTFVPAGTDTTNQIFTQPQYSGTGPVLAPEAWEAGWKDTIDCPPGMVTRVRAKFDLAGEKYVWHCHILSHEEHDMMRPLVVFADGVCGAADGKVLTSAPTELCVTGTPSAVSGTGPWSWTCQQQFGGVDSGTCSAALQTYTVVAEAAGAGEGNVSSSVGGISYAFPVTGTMTSAAIGHGTAVTLTATAISGGTVAWTACGGGVTAGSGTAIATCTYSSLTGSVTSGQAVATFRVHVALSAPLQPSPKPVGTSVPFIAALTGGSGPFFEYRFYTRPNGSTKWILRRDWQTAPEWTWETAPEAFGIYTVMVHARRLGSVANYDALKTITYKLTPATPASGVSLSALPASPRPAGTVITFTAGATGGDATGPYEYRFAWRASTTSTWTDAPAFTTTATWPWNTATLGLAAGTYYVRVSTRHVGNSVPYEAQRTTTYLLTSPAPATGAILAADPPGPRGAGTAVTFTTTPSGGDAGPYEFRYQYRSAVRGLWIDGSDPAYAGASWTWETGTLGLAAGSYSVRVYVRHVGNPVAEAIKYVTYELQ